MVQVKKTLIGADIMKKLGDMRADKENAFADAAIFILGLTNQVYERNLSVPFCVNIKQEESESKKIYASIAADDKDSAAEAINKLNKSSDEPEGYGMGNEDGLYNLKLSFVFSKDEALNITAEFDDEKIAGSKVETVLRIYKNLKLPIRISA